MSDEHSEYFFGKGLKNHGNTCYLNAGIQLLINNTDLLQKISKRESLGQLETFTSLFLSSNSFRNILRLWESGKDVDVCDPKDIIQFYIDMKQFQKGQDDSTRFLQGILGQFRKHVVELFEWQMESEFECKKCGYTEKNFYEPTESGLRMIGYNSPLEDCLMQIYKLEMPCEKCKSDADCFVVENVSKVPDYCCKFTILMLIFKVFGIDRKNIPHFPYEFPQKLTLNDELYRIWGFAVRRGKEDTSGHYYSYIFNESTKSWWEFDDTYAKEVNDDVAEKYFGKKFHPRSNPDSFAKLCQRERIHLVVYKKSDSVIRGETEKRQKVTKTNKQYFGRRSRGLASKTFCQFVKETFIEFFTCTSYNDDDYILEIEEPPLKKKKEESMKFDNETGESFP